MKKRIVSIMALSLVGTMMVGSLTGCGLQTKATDIVVDDGDTIIVDQEDMETETSETTEPVESVEPAETSEPDEITSSEVVGSETEEPDDFAGAENESILLYSEIEEFPTLAPLKDMEYNPANGTITANEDIIVYSGDGFEVGYIKNGSTISVTEFGVNALARFENPIEGTGYDYLYVLKKYVTDKKDLTLTTQDAENLIKEVLGNTDKIVYTDITEDMEVYEFRMPMYYNELESPKDFIYFQFKDFCENIWYHHTFSITCIEDTDNYILCQIYYKD